MELADLALTLIPSSSRSIHRSLSLSLAPSLSRSMFHALSLPCIDVLLPRLVVAAKMFARSYCIGRTRESERKKRNRKREREKERETIHLHELSRGLLPPLLQPRRPGSRRWTWSTHRLLTLFDVLLCFSILLLISTQCIILAPRYRSIVQRGSTPVASIKVTSSIIEKISMFKP